ncbi:hypothetical protein EPN83_03445 [Patescibacteria group bacterium]|nr:MAG: hypothetical protein EPN83_03445 [Patescibacteria group bacterium]
MNKRILTGIGILIFLILLGGGWYFFFSKGNPEEKTGGSTSPFGTPPSGSQANVPVSVPSGGGEATQLQTQTFGALRKISDVPVSGAGIFSAAGITFVRFIEAATGHVYESQPETGSVKKISNTTIPKIANVLWGPSGSLFLAQLEKDEGIETFAATLTEATTSTTTSQEVGGLRVKFLPVNISALALSPKGNQLFYVAKDSNGSRGYLGTAEGDKPALIWQSPLSEWTALWPKDDTIALTSKSSVLAPGYLFFLNPKTKNFSRVLRSEGAFTSLTHLGGEWTIFSEGRQDLILLNLFNRKEGTTQVSPATFPEKCVWSKLSVLILYCGVPRAALRGELPDQWYQGIVSFSDDIWKFNLETGETELVANLKDLSGGDIDIIDPQLSPREDLLLFRNKNDLTLWTLKTL